MKKFSRLFLSLILVFSLILSGCSSSDISQMGGIIESSMLPQLSSLPDYDGQPYAAVNNNVPYFSNEEITDSSFESYSELDSLKRCGTAWACVGQDLMPTEKRGSISQVKPAGWQSAEYDCVDGRHLYNRCHLIGFQLTGENANKQNLITGTRYLNTEGMLPFENIVADYVKETNHHVMYRVTPVYSGDNLLADGVLMEGYSVEDKGKGISFCVFAYNVQPGVWINYADGDSRLTEAGNDKEITEKSNYILNKNGMKFHRPDCSSVKQMKPANRIEFYGERQELISEGYSPCEKCHP